MSISDKARSGYVTCANYRETGAENIPQRSVSPVKKPQIKIDEGGRGREEKKGGREHREAGQADQAQLSLLSSSPVKKPQA